MSKRSAFSLIVFKATFSGPSSATKHKRPFVSNILLCCFEPKIADYSTSARLSFKKDILNEWVDEGINERMNERKLW